MKPLQTFVLGVTLSLGSAATGWLAAAGGHGVPDGHFEAATDLRGAAAGAHYAAAERAADRHFPGWRASTRHRQARLLGLDPRGDGRAVEVFGDLDAARRVAVLVPGSGWDLRRVMRNVGRRNANPVAAAADLEAELARLSPGTPTAVVSWLGYDAPEAIDRQSARSERAIAGGRALARFTRGLPRRAAVTLVGHSYGSVVGGRALSGFGARAEQLVALGSPGMDVATADQLGVPVWAARDPHDPIGFAPHLRLAGYGHGADPTAPRFGARVFATGRTGGHGGYYLPGTESLTNLARIVLGRTAEVTPAR
ncbi:alpha/beta hydrolase [Spirillospora sp. NPDC047279]|uniref:alpha/beta hydrolase n=1 Tax=Spirillospora sp. NPDC047279 TaxID=3155478 RepID=UPI0033FA8607